MAGFTPPPTQKTRLEGAPTWDLVYSSFGSFFGSLMGWLAPRLVSEFDSEALRVQSVNDDGYGAPQIWRIKGDRAIYILDDPDANDGAGSGMRLTEPAGTYAGAFLFHISAGNSLSDKLRVDFPAGRFKNVPGVAWSVQTRAEDPEWSVRIEVRHVESTASNESMELYCKLFNNTGPHPTPDAADYRIRLLFVESETS